MLASESHPALIKARQYSVNNNFNRLRETLILLWANVTVIIELPYKII